MTDFFERQAQAKRRTGVMLLYFTLAVALTVAGVYLVSLVIFAKLGRHPEPGLWHPQIFLGAVSGTLLVVGLGSLAKIMELTNGGRAVALALGGRQLTHPARDPFERRLINVVEEISIASGVPVPEIYVLDQERGINAFAAGRTPSDAAIGVTRGCMELLKRDELQGVIAHEFSHILNGDMRLNLRLMAIIAGIMCLAMLGNILLRVRSRGRDRGAGQLMLLGLALVILGYVGAFFGRLIQAAISRQREYLADAAAVQFTRLPEGLAGALKKIGGMGSELEAERAEEAAHFYFSNGVADSWFALWSTHPPLEERIRLLDPAWDGNYPAVVEPVLESGEGPMPAKRSAGPPILFPVPLPSWDGKAPPTLPAQAAQVLASVGQPRREHLDFAATMRQSLPPEIEQAVNEPFGASAVVYGLLLSAEESARTKQIAELTAATSSAMAEAAQRYLPLLQPLAPETKLPVLDLAIPSLRLLSAEQYSTFEQAVAVLIESDQKLELFEFTLQKVLRRHLAPTFRPEKKTVINYNSLKGLAAECALLLSAMAHAGQDDAAQAQAAFAAGARQLGLNAANLPFMPWAECSLGAVDAALEKFAAAVPHLREALLRACAQTVASDGVIAPAEVELLRAFADVLGCPIPPYTEERRQAIA